MTPQRAKWWAELPGEEKRVRLETKECKRKIKWIKEELPHSFGHYREAIKDGLRRNKILINALRKQIAMKPWERKGVHPIHCPCCWTWIYANGYKPPYCDRCGQKLRWD